MIVKYDAINRAEAPILTLCNPGSQYIDGVITKSVGILTDYDDLEFIYNFNATSEMNFTITKVSRDVSDVDTYTDNMYSSILGRRLIYAEGIGYFSINHIEETTVGEEYKKSVTAESIDIELQQKALPYIKDGTYRMRSSGTDVGILDAIVSITPLWLIGHVDSSVASMYRTFEDVSTEQNVLSFMLEDMQEAYECIFIFDCINRTINVYDQRNYVRDTSIYITNEDVINQLGVTENADDVYTAISAYGGGSSNELSISAINPIGGNVIYNFDYYLDWMSESLSSKVSSWKAAVNSRRPQYFTLAEQYYSSLQDVYAYEQDVDMYQKRLTLYKRCKDNIVSESGSYNLDKYNGAIQETGGSPVTGATTDALLQKVKQLITDTTNLMNAAIASLASARSTAEAKEDAMQDIRNAIGMEHYFSSSELEELSCYIFEGTYNDQYIAITDSMTYPERLSQMRTLLDRAEQQLSKASEPTQEFTVDTQNFVFDKNFEHWTQQLETGSLISVLLHGKDVAKLFLTNITVNYSDDTLSLTFGNRYNKFDAKSLFEDVLGKVKRSANTLQMIKDVIFPIKDGDLDLVKERIDNSRNITMADALSATNETIVMDGSGYLARKDNGDGTYDDRQLKIGSHNIVFTKDGWETASTAIGEINIDNQSAAYGVNAEVLIGNIVIGNELHIMSSDGEDIETRFDAMQGQISSKVSTEDYNGNTIASMINQTPEEITINASKVLFSPESGTTLDGALVDLSERIDTASEEKQAQINELMEKINGVMGEAIFKSMSVESDGVHFTAVNGKNVCEIINNGAQISFTINGVEVSRITSEGFLFDSGILTSSLTIGEGSHQWMWTKVKKNNHFRLIHKSE